VVEPVPLARLLLLRLGDHADAAGLEVERGEGAPEREGDSAPGPRDDGADRIAQGVAAVLARGGIEGMKGVAFDVDPVEELPARVPDGAFAEPRLRVENQLDRLGHGPFGRFSRRERSARGAERFLCRLSTDSLRRETFNEDKRVAERAASGSGERDAFRNQNIPGSFIPPVRPPIFSCTASSTLRAASLTAAVTRSWSISTSSLLTTSGSIFRLLRFFCPSITTFTMPPPEVASISRAWISFWMRSWACWSCFMSCFGLPKGFMACSPALRPPCRRTGRAPPAPPAPAPLLPSAGASSPPPAATLPPRARARRRPAPSAAGRPPCRPARGSP